MPNEGSTAFHVELVMHFDQRPNQLAHLTFSMGVDDCIRMFHLLLASIFDVLVCHTTAVHVYLTED